MPYYPEDQSNENIKKLIQTNVCKDCGRQLYAFLDRESKQTYIACPTPGHEGIVREYQPQSTDYRSEIRREIELETQHGRETAKELATIPKHGQLNQDQAMTILQLVYPKAPQEEIVRCAMLCRDFGLHPLMKEVYLIPFKDKRTGQENYVTVLGINATRKLMSQRGTYSYLDNTPKVMNEETQMEIFGEVDTLNVKAITKLRTKDGLEAQGYGSWPKNKEPYGTDKGNSQANMAFIRSERNAFGRLFTDALPKGIDIVDDQYVDVPDVGKVSLESGEVIEGEAKEIPESTPEPSTKAEPEPGLETREHWCEEHNCQFDKKVRGSSIWYAHKLPGGKWCNEKDNAKAHKGAQGLADDMKDAIQDSHSDLRPEPSPEPAESTAEPNKQRRDPSAIKTINELFKACNADFNLQPEDVIKELGVSSQSDISDTPEECYRKILAVRI